MVGFSITCSGSLQQTDRVNPTGLMRSAAIVAALAVAGCAAEAESDKSERADLVAAVELASVSEIDPIELEKLSKARKIRIIDVRTDEEVAEGIIPGAEHIALDAFDPAKLDLSDGREPVFYCRSDRRSGIAAEKFAKVTGKKVLHLKGGIKAWEEAKLPVQKPPALF